jgi:hypothetical protein
VANLKYRPEWFLKQDKIEYEELELELEEELLPIYEHELYQKTSKQKKEKQKYKIFLNHCYKKFLIFSVT